MKMNLTILFCIFSISLIGQDFDHLMVKKQFDCPDVSAACSFLFIYYWKENKLDSAKRLINYWERKCSFREPLRRAKILLALKEGNFHDSLLAKGMIQDIMNFQDRMNIFRTNDSYTYDTYRSYFGFIPPGQDFDRFTWKVASEMENEYSPGSMEHLLCVFYGGQVDSVFIKLQSSAYSNSVLYKEYFHIVQRYLDQSEFHISWLTGIWIPTGGISQLGLHPELGFQMGMKRKKMNYDLTMCFKFGDTPKPYYTRRTHDGDSLFPTKYFIGGYIGFDVGRDILNKRGHELQVLAGIGLDGFDTMEEDDQNLVKVESIFTYNFNFGLEHRYYFSNSFYLGLQLKYNITDYSINNIVDFTGNPITLRLILGGFSNANKRKNLDLLKYKWRK